MSQGPISPAEDLLFGRIAVHLKFITAQDLTMVTSAQQRAAVWRPLGQMLIAEGLITEEQVQHVLAFQRERGAATGAPRTPAPPPPAARPAAAPPPPTTAAAAKPNAAALAAIRAFVMEDDGARTAPSRTAPSEAPPAPPATAAKPSAAALDAIRAFAMEDDDARAARSPAAPAQAPPATPATAAPPVAPASTAGLATPPHSNPGATPASTSRPASHPGSAAPAWTAPPHSNPGNTPGATAAAKASASAAPTVGGATGSAVQIIPAAAPLPPRPATADPHAASPTRSTDPSALHRVLRAAIDNNASDIHMHSGARLRFRINGALREMSDDLLSPWEVGPTVLAALTESEYQAFLVDGEVDFPYTATDIGRFRCNLYRQQHGIDAVFRSVPDRPPSLADLGLPPALGKLANYHQGIVLFTGPSGCGKSATMNAVLNMVNQDRPDHILTIEDPVEVLHESAQSIVNQRQAKTHTASFGRALRAALREDPDVICIGEMRDFETISLAVSAAETGHLVMGTLHTSSAIRTISRVLGVFPPSQQDQVRSMVAESLRAIISQRLVARADGKGRVAALEILYVNQAVANLIRENRTMMIKSVLQTGQAAGMCSLDNSLEALVKDGTITRQEAARHAEEPKKFQ